MTADDDLGRALEKLPERGASRTYGKLVALDEVRAALAARSDITQAATGGPDFTPKEWPEPRAEGLREAWAAYTMRFADPHDPARHSETTIRDAFEAGWDAALAARSEPRAEGLPWTCDWEPDDLNPAEDGCPYCAGRMCARFDGLGCTHNREERHGYAATPPAEGLDVERPGILDESIEGNVQREDALRVLELALASQGVPDVNAPSLLRDIEEGGYTLRLTTHDERRRRLAPEQPE